ncbi:MAG: hypothetical protein GY782_01280 [Gammaproteobacteria bacterium]|nr:hypothetical protein [Gammaproteobacteria bacterium]
MSKDNRSSFQNIYRKNGLSLSFIEIIAIEVERFSRKFSEKYKIGNA